MYKVHLFQHKSQFNIVFNVNPGHQGFKINIRSVVFVSGHVDVQLLP
jgi:hypothetical protein